jgi:hypothetical protein
MNIILKKAALDDIKLAIELQNKAFEQFRNYTIISG